MKLRWLRRLFTIALLGLVALLTWVAVIGSNATLTPKRRSVEDWHRTILSQSENHGLQVSQHTARQGTPYLICQPSAQPAGQKATELRKALQARGTRLAPWGTVHGTIILLHGHKGCKEDHLPICERFCAAGFRCLCIDLPGHGQNPSPYATFGHQEISLLKNLWRELQQTHPELHGPMALFGISQGGAIALQSAAEKDWSVAAVASVAAFASLDQPIATSANYLPAYVRAIKPLTTRACGLGIYCRCGFFPSQISPLRAAAQIDCPAFLCHGKLDTFIPPDAATRMHATIPHPQKHLRLIDGAKHHNVLAVGSTELYADICEFFLNALPRS
jgi:uncharacterized protein